MAGKLPNDPPNLPPATDESEATLMGAPSPFAPQPAAPPRPAPAYGRQIQFRPAPAAAQVPEQPDSTQRGQPAFDEAMAQAPVEESNQTMMQQSPFMAPPKLPDADLSVEPTAVKGSGPIAAPAPPPKRATGARPALKLPDPPAPMEESGSTLIFDSKRHAPASAPAAAPVDENATFMLSGAAAQAQRSVTEDPSSDSNDDPTQDPKAKREARRSVSRPAPPDPPEHTVNIAAKVAKAQATIAGPQAFILLIMATVAIALGASLLKGDAKPSTNDLRAIYPYGLGGRLPNGRTAPGAFEVDFELVKTLECHGQICNLYKARDKGGGFEMDMLVYREGGSWLLDASGGLSAAAP